MAVSSALRAAFSSLMTLTCPFIFLFPSAKCVENCRPRLRKNEIEVPQGLEPAMKIQATERSAEALLHPKPEFFRSLLESNICHGNHQHSCFFPS